MTDVTLGALLRRPGGFIPLLLSAAALALVVGWVGAFGVTHQPDEGGAARIFQLLMLVQLIVAMLFAVAWLPSAPRAAFGVLALQLCAAAVPVVTIILLES